MCHSAWEWLCSDKTVALILLGDVSGYQTCRFRLAAIGKFALESCVEDEDGKSACFRAFLGKSQEEWEDR